MMTNFLEATQSTLIQASIIGSLTIIVIGLLDRAFPLHPIARSWLWRICFLKIALLICVPFAIPQIVLPGRTLETNTESSERMAEKIAALNSLPTSDKFSAFRKTSNDAGMDSSSQPIGNPNSIADSLGNNQQKLNRSESSPSPFDTYLRPLVSIQASITSMSSWLLLLWSLGVIVQVVLLGMRYGHLRTVVRRRRQNYDPAMADMFRQVVSQLRLRTEPNFRLIDVPCSPFLMLGYPISVVFPSDFAEQFDQDECRMAMSHELSHYVRRDLWWNTVVSFVSITLFFVPFVWFAARRYRASQELACDWLAVQQSRVDSRHYAQLLVQMVERFQHRSPSPAILSMAGSESFRTLSERLKTMKKFHEMKSHRRWLTSAPVWLLAAVVLVPFGFSEDDDAKSKKKSKKSSGSVPTYNSSSDAPKPQPNSSSASASSGGFSFGSSSGSSSGSSAGFGSFSSGGGSSGGSAAYGGGSGSAGGSTSSSDASTSNPSRSRRSSRSISGSGGSSGGSGSTMVGGSSNSDELNVTRSVIEDDGEIIKQVHVITKTHEATIRESSVDGIELRLRARKSNRKKEQIYEASSVEEFAEKHPSVYSWIEKYRQPLEKNKANDGQLSAFTISDNAMTVGGAAMPPDARQLLREQLSKTMSEQNDPNVRESLNQLLKQLDNDGQ